MFIGHSVSIHLLLKFPQAFVFSSNQISAAGVYVLTRHGEISTTVNFQVRHPYWMEEGEPHEALEHHRARRAVTERFRC